MLTDFETDELERAIQLRADHEKVTVRAGLIREALLTIESLNEQFEAAVSECERLSELMPEDETV